MNRFYIVVLDDAVVACLHCRLFTDLAGRAADVEGAHCELGARLPDGLGGNHADRLPQLD